MRMSDWSSDVCSSDLDRTKSDEATLGRAHAIVRDRRHVTDRRDLETHRLERAERRFATRTGAFDFDFERADAVFGGLLAGILGRDLRRVRGDRKSVVSGKRMSVRVDLGGRRIIKKNMNVTISVNPKHKIK